MKLIVIGILFYILYSVTIKPMLSNKKLIDTNQWDQEEEQYIEYEEVDEVDK